MIDYIKGTIAYKSPTFVTVETAGGVAYRLHISLGTYAKIEALEKVQLLAYLQIKDDAHVLYGFADEAERSLFSLLLSVSGVGGSTAQIILSSMSTDEVRAAILNENEVAFSRVKGIGPKTAKRILLDLKDKVKKDGGDDILSKAVASSTVRDEALAALLALGFQRIPAQKALNKILQARTDSPTVEDLIRIALKEMA